MPEKVINKLICSIILGIMICVFGNACKTAVGTVATDSEPASVESVLVLPFKNMAAVYGENMSVRCPLDGKVFLTGQISGDAEGVLTSHLIMLIKKRCECRMIMPSSALGVVSKLINQNQKTIREKKLLVETGRILGADVVVTGHIYKFQERLGRKYSVEYPAAVTFDIHIIKVDSGRVIWSGKFDETQRSLDKNFLNLRMFIKRKGMWVTARQMAAEGLEELFEKFPLTGL